MPNINDKLAANAIDALRTAFGKNVPQILTSGFAMQVPISTDGNLMQFDSLQHQAQAIFENNSLTLKKGEAPPSSVRYLKWQEDHCTGMALDAGANVFLTGPFQGCSFFMFTDVNLRSPVILHSNSNLHRGDPDARNAAQRKMAEEYKSQFHQGSIINFEAQYELNMKNKQGWIIGVKIPDSRNWKISYIITEDLGAYGLYYRDLDIWNPFN